MRPWRLATRLLYAIVTSPLGHRRWSHSRCVQDRERCRDDGEYQDGKPLSPGFSRLRLRLRGALSNEMYNVIARNTDELYEGIAIGGDAFPGSSLLDHLLRYEVNPEIKMVVCLGELGGTAELEIAQAVKDGRLKKPLVMWVTGTCAKVLPGQVQFGHARART